MSLRLVAEGDLATTLEDGVCGFGWPIVLTSPDGTSAELTGTSDDIAQVIDPDTGQAVSGRVASAVLRTSSILSVFSSLPEAIADSDLNPWIVEFSDINGMSYRFKVSQSNPDRALGVISLLLEVID